MTVTGAGAMTGAFVNAVLVEEEFDAAEYYHIGDTNMDRQYAERAGFSYLYPDPPVDQLWAPN